MSKETKWRKEILKDIYKKKKKQTHKPTAILRWGIVMKEEIEERTEIK